MKNTTSQTLLLFLWLCFIETHLAAQQPCKLPSVPTAAAAQNIFSEAQEKDLGDAVAEQMALDYRVIDDEEVAKHLREIGGRLIMHLPPTNLRFQFYLFDINDVNAFTLPGGRIYVSRKMVAFARNEDELAGVVAHELGHIVARHSTIDMTILFREVLGVTQVTDRHDIFEKYHQLIENQARRSKAFEKLDNHEAGNQNVADLIGLYAMIGAGYDPHAQAALWDRYHELKGKTGGFFASLFGRTKPEQKRLREMLNSLSTLPPECRGAKLVLNEADFKRWQTSVVSFSGSTRKELLTGLLQKKSLIPALRSEINHLRFSPDGQLLLVQDDSGINVLSRQPLASLFRIDAPDARPAQFSPDSRTIVFYTHNLRVELWDISEQRQISAYEVVIRKSCFQTALSPDGKALACLDTDFNLTLIEVPTSATIYEKKSFSQMEYFEAVSFLVAAMLGGEIGDQEFVSMAFSPDAKYFVAGDRSFGYTSLGYYTETQSVAYDLTSRATVPVKGDLKKIIAGGFAFVGADKIVGRHPDNLKESGLYRFPSGEAIEKFEVFSSALGPVTSGRYVLLRNFGKLSGGLLDLTTRRVTSINQSPVLDAYDDVLAIERANSELGLHNLKTGATQVFPLPQNPLGRIYAAYVTPDFSWLALSGYSRGAVWNVDQGKMVLHLRAFRGAYIAEDKTLYADFPKQEKTARNIAHLSLVSRDASLGASIENGSAHQYDAFVVQFKPGKKGGSYWENVTMEVLDAKTMAVSWSMTFPKERPRNWMSPRDGTMTLVWPVSAKAASEEIKAKPALSTQMSQLREKEGDYLIKVLDLKKGELLGEFLMETGKGSFRLQEVIADGDRVAMSDNQNRILVYSLASGRQLGKVFGNRAIINATSNLLCVENKEGLLELYDLTSFAKRQQYSFANRISLFRFDPNGRRLFVLTSNQTVYLLDVSSTSAKTPG